MQKVPFELFRFVSKCRQMFHRKKKKKKEKEKKIVWTINRCLDVRSTFELISVNGIREFDERCFAWTSFDDGMDLLDKITFRSGTDPTPRGYGDVLDPSAFAI